MYVQQIYFYFVINLFLFTFLYLRQCTKLFGIFITLIIILLNVNAPNFGYIFTLIYLLKCQRTKFLDYLLRFTLFLRLRSKLTTQFFFKLLFSFLFIFFLDMLVLIGLRLSAIVCTHINNHTVFNS